MNYRIKISGLILNDQGELLIFKNKEKSVWTCPGGKIEEGETELECLKRELKEEAGIDLKDAEFLVETDVELAAGSTDKYVIMKFYIVKDYSGELRINPDDSVEMMDWISKSEFDQFKNGESEKFKEIGSGLVQYAIPRLIEMNLMRG